eukprot:scaffold368_cov258-Pinguiococcus_pyrenoidosus.AAC.17
MEACPIPAPGRRPPPSRGPCTRAETSALGDGAWRPPLALVRNPADGGPGGAGQRQTETVSDGTFENRN